MPVADMKQDDIIVIISLLNNNNLLWEKCGGYMRGDGSWCRMAKSKSLLYPSDIVVCQALPKGEERKSSNIQ